MEKEGSLVWLNCEWLLAHHYQSKLIPKKIKGKKKEKKKRKRKTVENQKHPVPFLFIGNCTVGAKQQTHQNYNKERPWSEKFSR